MVQLKTEDEISFIRRSGEILGKAHAEVAKLIKPGVQTAQLDKIAEQYIRDAGAVPSFKNYNGFPYTLCISVNSVVVHGMPSDYTLQSGDIVSIDCGVFQSGFHADSAYTYPVGQVEPEVRQLLQATKEALYAGLREAAAGNRLGDMSFAIQQFVEQRGYSVVRELVGHGIGRHLHEGPEVPNYGKRGQGLKLQEGLVLAVEPMVNLGRRHVVQESDGWTIRTRDRKPSAHFEHTVAIRKGEPEVLTTFKYIEEVLTTNG